ncbi:MAG: hypothetical protein PVG85_00645 [Deltaproteobacteria bacterium]|jgi:hypothetical protein
MIRDARQYVVELDGVTYLCSDDELGQIGDLKDIRGDTWFVSDFEKAIARTMTVEAPVKYAEMMVRKKLQETGEFDEPISVINHWKRKKGKNATDIFFTAVPTRLYCRYLEDIKAHEDSVLLFPLFSVLQAVLRRMRHPKPAAVVFQHGRFADLVIGTNRTVIYANRCMAFDTSEEQMSAVWDMVKTDITAAEEEHRIKVDRILLLTWIDSGTGPEWSDESEREVLSMEEENLSCNGEDYSVSFLKALRMNLGLRALSPPLEKVSYYSRRLLPCLNVIFFAAILLCVVGYLSYGQKADALGEQLLTAERRIAGMEHEAPVQEIPYKETLSFVKDLARYRKAPSYKRVVSDISEALPKGASVEVLKVDYAEEEVNIELFGKTNEPFGLTYKGYQRFIDALTQGGYEVAESRLDTEIRQSQFLARFTKKIQ